MITRPSTVLALVVVAILAFGLGIYGAAVSPAEPPAATSGARLPAARFFVLLPGGRVEITDAWERRVFRWDGRQWVLDASSRAPAAVR